MSSPSYTLEMFVKHFRAICDAVILHCVREKTQKTQAASLLLDHGNARFAVMERSSGQASAKLHPSILLLSLSYTIIIPCPAWEQDNPACAATAARILRHN